MKTHKDDQGPARQQRSIKAFFVALPGLPSKKRAQQAQNTAPPCPASQEEGPCSGGGTCGSTAPTAGNRQGVPPPLAAFACGPTASPTAAMGGSSAAPGTQGAADESVGRPRAEEQAAGWRQQGQERQQVAEQLGERAEQRSSQQQQTQQQGTDSGDERVLQEQGSGCTVLQPAQQQAGQQAGQQHAQQQAGQQAEQQQQQQQAEQQQQQQQQPQQQQHLGAAGGSADAGPGTEWEADADAEMADAAGGKDGGSGPAAPGPAGAGGTCSGSAEGGHGKAASGNEGGGLTEYERMRLERIRRNQEVMLSMGLGGPGIERKRPAAPLAKRPPRKRSASEGEGAGGASAPVRRSSRNRGAPCGTGNEAAAAAAAAGEPQGEAQLPEPERQYDDSSVRRYVCEVLAAAEGEDEGAAAGGAGGAGGADGATVSGFRRLPGCLSDPALARAYSIDWRPGLVVAGGKDGVVSVFGSRAVEAGRLAAGGGGEAAPPLLSHKLHRGWVSDVQLVSSSGGGGNGAGGSGLDAGGSDSAHTGLLLLTAGNDGAVCLWDIGRAAEAGGRGGGMPQCLATSVELHSSGVFSLHELGGRVLTASKDGTLAISSLGGGGSSTASLAAVHLYDELHNGVVKCARWRDQDTFASCGNDRALCIVDTRQPVSAGASLAIADAHGTAINCLRWHPACHHLLLSASHDPAILLHDIRSPTQPLHRFLGHSQAARIGSIYQPAFVAGGDAIAASCEKSALLSLYCTRTGTTISRGGIDIAVGATFCGRRRGDPLLCSASRAVYMYRPTWQHYSNAL